MTRRILLMIALIGVLALQADAQWIGRMWGSAPGVDFIKSVNVPGGRATGFTSPDVGTRVANQMQGYWQMCIEDFNVPSYFEPFQNDQPELLGQPFNKFVNDYMQDALDWTYDKFRYGDGELPKYFRNQPPTVTQDGTSLGDPDWTIFANKGDQVISDLPADFMQPYEGFRAGGMSERSRVYAWQSPEQDDFFINVRSFGRPDPAYVPDQAARGEAYARFNLEALRRPHILGQHWCAFLENRNRKSGVKNYMDETYWDCVNKMKDFNLNQLYQTALKTRRAESVK